MSCKDETRLVPQDKLYTLMDSDSTGIAFTNSVTNSEKFNIFSYRNFYNGGGVGIGDLDNDGLPEVLLTSNMGENKLYKNKGNFKFEDVSKQSKINSQTNRWSTGIVFVDINSDGLLDIYICNAGFTEDRNTSNQLFVNKGDLVFEDQTNQYGIGDTGYTTHSSFFDYDLDGDLDLYVLNNSFIPVNTLNYSNKRDLRAKDWPVKDFLKGGGDKLYRNEGGTFVDVSEQAGIYGSLIGFGLGISVSDLNGDHYPDIYISNDFFERDYLYYNNGDGTFRELLEEEMTQISLSSMGSDIADINNDLHPDIFATDMLPDDRQRLYQTTSFEGIEVNNLKLSRGFYHQYVQNALQVNDGFGGFSETANYSGVSGSDWSWGALIYDADNDGLKDIIVSNGIYKDVIDQDFIDFFANTIIQEMVRSGEKTMVDSIVDKMPSTPIPNKAFKNIGGNKFEDSANSWGLDKPGFSNGAAYGDLDGDGDLDLVINNVNEPSLVYKNNANSNSVRLLLKGDGSNSYAIGSKIKVYAGDWKSLVEVYPSRGFQSSVDYNNVIGLGSNKMLDSIIVEWYDGSKSILLQPKINEQLIIDKKELNALTITQQHSKTFTKAIQELPAHQEDNYIDFYNERGIFEMVSREGPAYANGDLDGDGIEEMFIGGAKGQPGKIYTRKNENWVEYYSFDSELGFEDTAAAFADVDGDSDLDLIIGSGGNYQPPLTREMQDRVYLNDNGVFTINAKALPDNGMNTSVILPIDYDHDGDIDLFVGSVSYPMIYGRVPNSYLYTNDGKGNFRDFAKSINPLLANCGFITDAILSDLDSDKNQELIITRKWDSPLILSNIDNGFEVLQKPMNIPKGMWTHINVADIDNDGDQDLLFGNYGANFSLSKYPLNLLLNDFDDNKTIDKVVSQTLEGRERPIFMKRDFIDQLPNLRKIALKHKEYAKMDLDDLLGNDKINESSRLTASDFNSAIYRNDGSFVFNRLDLPKEAQYSSVNASLFIDIDNDGDQDLILGGNMDKFLPQFGKIDGSRGLILYNDGKGIFEYKANDTNNLNLRGEVKHIIKQKNQLIILRNNKSHLILEQPNK